MNNPITTKDYRCCAPSQGFGRDKNTVVRAPSLEEVARLYAEICCLPRDRLLRRIAVLVLDGDFETSVLVKLNRGCVDGYASHGD